MTDHTSPWRDWYQLERWRKKRRMQLMAHPLCAMCLPLGKITRAEIADHVIEHEGDWNAFWTGELQSLCTPCHNSRKRLLKERGYDPEIGLDGWPVDKRHPVYR